MRYLTPVLFYIITIITMTLLLLSDLKFYDYSVFAAVTAIALIFLFSGYGFFSHSLNRYVLFSCLVQLSYLVLAYLASQATGNQAIVIVQLINFAIAGLLLSFILTLFYREHRLNRLIDYNGIYDENQHICLALIVSCLSLSGLPVFNMFTSEFFIYKYIYGISPVLMVISVFSTLIVFLFYFRLCYIIFAGEQKEKLRTNVFSKALIAIIFILTITLGIIPQLFPYLLEMVL